MISEKNAFLFLTVSAALIISSCATSPEPKYSKVIQHQRQVKVIRPQSNIKSANKQNFGTNNNYQSSQDNLGRLIKNNGENYKSDQLNIERRLSIRKLGEAPYGTQKGVIFDNLDFNQWLSLSTYRANQVAKYQSYLTSYVGAYAVPPMNQLLTSSRSWQRCGYDPYILPPRELWSNMIPTLRLYDTLKSRGIIPKSSEIRSVYRSPGLNDCSGGATNSKHMTNGAIDIWVPEYDEQPWYINPMQDKLCQFWSMNGEALNFGLGLYVTGSVHLDTQGYRMWGARNTSHNSICRYL